MQIYITSSQSKNGHPAIPTLITFVAIFIKENDNLIDEDTVSAIKKNPYMQNFFGLQGDHADRCLTHP